ncbi:MAG TPA: 2OG-Fe(II) oxygenase family protein [Pyrinomonadaceae bacterium]|nr:2OG-Fe(II) oxygenase family protein [Pyrinomonadaceae bacterium]
MKIPVLHSDDIVPMELCNILSELGCFRLRHSVLPNERLAEVLDDARAFFDLPQEIKSAIAIEHSRHFRGYSEMKNERDWREQLHLGAEREAIGDVPPFLQLEGPNLWPPDPDWRDRILRYLSDVANVGQEVLANICAGLGSERNSLADKPGLDPYLVMKLICYHPQPDIDSPRPGVAAHVDFSWITLTLEDNTGGLDIRIPDGRWITVEPEAGTLLVHVGEILAFATQGRFCSTPHRVVNRLSDQSRLSLPIFLNPNLQMIVTPIAGLSDAQACRTIDASHVHRVLSPNGSGGSFLFGAAEWRRKGLNVWCTECVSE